MGCGCGKANLPQKYIFEAPGKQPVTYEKEIQARVAQIQAGGVGTITPVAK